MPRRQQRFAQLERELEACGFNPAPGSRAAAYLDFRKGINNIKMERPASSDERKRKGVAILPFGLSLPEAPIVTNRYRAYITNLSNIGRNGLGLGNNELGYEAVVPATQKPGNFYAALLKIFARSSMIQTSPTSGILKKEYKRYPGRNYSVPFGRSATLGGAGFTVQNIAEEQSRQILVQRIVTANALALISYEPELFTSPEREVPSLL